jgi:hypothetical protein
MNIRTSVALLGALALAAAACKPRQFGESGVKDVAAYGGDHFNQVPAHQIVMNGELALDLVKNIKWGKVIPESHGVTRRLLRLSEDAWIQCANEPNPKAESCAVMLLNKDYFNVKSVPCDDKCKKENMVFGKNRDALGNQHVAIVQFTKEDALALFNALNLPVEKQLLMPLEGLIWGNDINIPGKILTNVPREINDDVELPKQAYFLQCSLQGGENKNEPKCGLILQQDHVVD